MPRLVRQTAVRGRRPVASRAGWGGGRWGRPWWCLKRGEWRLWASLLRLKAHVCQLRPWLEVKRFPGGGCRCPSRSSTGPVSVFLHVHCAVPARRACASALMICWSPCVRDTCLVARSQGRRLAEWPLRCHLALSKWPGTTGLDGVVPLVRHVEVILRKGWLKTGMSPGRIPH